LLAGALGVAALGSSPASASAACVAPYCPSHTLTVVKAGTGSGTVTSSPAGIECGAKCAAAYEEGVAVTLSAKAGSGSVFTGWSGGGCHGTKSCTLTIAADTTVTATFRRKGQSGGGAEGLAEVAPTAPVRAGMAALGLHCTGAGPCHGTLTLTAKIRRGKKKKRKAVVIATAPFDLAAGASTTMKVRLSKPARRILKKRRRLKARATGPGLTSSTVTLKLAKKKHRR
jgi:hypothetical protein